jgi:hypothetical protein
MRDSSNSIQYFKAAFALIAVLVGFLIFFSVLSLFNVNSSNPNPSGATPADDVPFLACNFTNTGADAVPLYNAPYAHAHHEFYSVRAGIPYPVVSFNTDTDFIEIDVQGITGYVDPFSGMAVGECDESYIPRDERRLTDFHIVCVFTLTTSAPVFSDPSLTQQTALRQADERFILLEKSEQGFLIANSKGFSGWVNQQNGTQAGACGAIPQHETGLN